MDADRSETESPERTPARGHLQRLSKLLAFLLRHRPDQVDLRLDPDGGWVDIESLIERINARRRLPFRLLRTHIEQVVHGQSGLLFELDRGRLRARGGHSIEGVSVPTDEPPEFLFLDLGARELARRQGNGALIAGSSGVLRLQEDESGIPEERLVVVEAGRAFKQGVRFTRLENGPYGAASIPLRFVVSARAGYVRQVSAGGVLVRRLGDEIEVALIRTLPRDQAMAGQGGPPEAAQAASDGAPATAEAAESPSSTTPSSDTATSTESDSSSPCAPAAQLDGDDEAPRPDEPPDLEDARGREDRRSVERRQRDEPPPGGVERRQGRSRRMQRRRRSGRWGPEGRLELPKGKVEPGETVAEAAVREVREEMGITGHLEVGGVLSKNHYAFRTPDGKCIFKTVHYYLLVCDEARPDFAPRREEGIVSVEWWTARRALQQVAFPNLRPVLEQALLLAEQRV